ncbi:hypothetical protein BH24DEI1_BH24DEI1_00730 [soil metagenome]
MAVETAVKIAVEQAWSEGVRLFDSGAFWECHEALEPLWMAATGLDKDFYKGVILLAAALHKARPMGSARGGRRNYAKALVRLAPLPDHYHGVAVRELEAVVHAALRDPALEPRLPLRGRGKEGGEGSGLLE